MAYLLTNEIEIAGFHIEDKDDYANPYYGNALDGDHSLSGTTLSLKNANTLKIGDQVWLANDSTNLYTIVADLGSNQYTVDPDFQADYSDGDPVILHYKKLRGQVSRLSWEEDRAKEQVRNLQKADMLPTDVAYRKAENGTLTLEMEPSADMVYLGLTALKFDPYSSFMALALGDVDLYGGGATAKCTLDPRPKTEEIQPFSFLAVGIDDSNWSGVWLFCGCVVEEVNYRANDEKLRATFTIRYKYIYPITLGSTKLDIAGSGLISAGGTTVVPEHDHGSPYLPQGDIDVKVYPSMRVLSFNAGRDKIYVSDTSYLPNLAATDVITIRKADGTSETRTVSSVGADYVEVSVAVSAGYEPKECFILSPNRLDYMTSLDVMINNRIEPVTRLQSSEERVHKLPALNQDITARLNYKRQDQSIVRASLADPYNAQIWAVLLMDKDDVEWELTLYRCIMDDNAGLEWRNDPEYQEPTISLRPADYGVRWEKP